MKPSLPLALLLALACGEPAPEHPPTAAAPSASTAWVAARSPATLSLLQAPARVLVDPGARAAVSAPLPARVVRFHVREGSTVARGQPLVDVVMPELIRSAGAYLAAGVRLEAARARQQRLENLRKENLARISEVAAAETDVAEARAARIEAEAVLRGAGFNGAGASRLASGSGTVSLHSPIDGMVVALGASTGDRVDAASGPLVRIAGRSAPRVEARLATAWPENVAFRFISAGGAAHPVVIQGRSPDADARDGTVLAWFIPEDEQLSLPAGTPGVLEVAPGADVLAVPLRAVAVDDGASIVFVRTPEGVRRVPVAVLATSGADALVKGEIAAGAQVAADADRLLISMEGAP